VINLEMKILILFCFFLVLALSFKLTKSQSEVVEKMIFQAKNETSKFGKITRTAKSSLDTLSTYVCPTPVTCCITIWTGENAPTDGLTTFPCTNNVFFY